jgi:phosphoribosyl 1,2-cyclic phosphodiesterase
MSFRVQALASGSSGNAMLVTHSSVGETTALLIDAGTGLRELVASLQAHGVSPTSIAGILVTHEHTDHVRSAHAFSRKYGAPLVANRRTLSAVYAGKPETPHHELPTGFRWSAGEIEAETFPVPHDAAEPVGVNIHCLGHKCSQITDAGSVTSEMRRAIRKADLLILETNHDVHRLRAGPYPDILKRRILSDTGHLSNETAVGLMIDHLMDKGPCTLWLAHLSKVNNLPRLALNYAKATLKLETRCPFVMDIALRDRPSATWSPGLKPLQLNLF